MSAGFENSKGLEPLIVPGKYEETLPFDAIAIADGATLALSGNRHGGKWHLNVRDFSSINGQLDSEHTPPKIGEIVTEADPHPLESSFSYDFAHAIAAGWLGDRGLVIIRDIYGTRLGGSIVRSIYEVMKSPTE